MGWGQRLDLPRSPVTHRFEVERELPVGRFPYKLLCVPVTAAAAAVAAI